MAEKENQLSDSEKKKEDWMNSKWRPMMGWMYMFVCFFDFVIAPVMWSILQALDKGSVNTQWQPLTLQGAGLFHIAMGAVIGISAYGRTQEKLGGANNGGIQLPPGAGTTYVPPGGTTNLGNQQSAMGGGFGGQQSSGFGSTNSFGSAPAASGFGSSSGFGATTPAASSFGATTPAASSFGATTPAASSFGSASITSGFGGKKAPPPADEPAI